MTSHWSLRWMLCLVCLTASLVVLWRTGEGDLAPPPLSVDGALAWMRDRDPVVTAFALLRAGSILAGSYLVGVVVVSGLVHAVDAHRGSALLERWTLGVARSLFGTVGFGALAMAVAPPAPAQAPSSSTAVIREVDATSEPPTSQATIKLLAHAPPPAPASSTPQVQVVPSAEQHSVAAGESLWSIAEARMQEESGRDDVADHEVAPYWRRVVDANALPNPDLLFVGQVIELPAVTPP